MTKMSGKKKLVYTLLAVALVASVCACVAFSAHALEIIDGFEGSIDDIPEFVDGSDGGAQAGFLSSLAEILQSLFSRMILLVKALLSILR